MNARPEDHQTAGPQQEAARTPSIALLGNPNVGKSALFNALTSTYVTVSNYPGTTVETFRGTARIDGVLYEIIDTPGMYSLLPITEEERVGRALLFSRRPDIVLHVIDAKNIERMLPFTLQLIEAELPVILVINMIDEAAKLGIVIDTEKIEERLGIPVVSVAATRNHGIAALKHRLREAVRPSSPVMCYGDSIEDAVRQISGMLPEGDTISKRTRALLLLQEDQDMLDALQSGPAGDTAAVNKIISSVRAALNEPVEYSITLGRQAAALDMLSSAVSYPADEQRGLNGALSRITMNPWSGPVILFLVLYYALYKFVGVFGAGTMVDFIESTVFKKLFNPWITGVVSSFIPWKALQDLFIGEYGMLTLGLRYAAAIILPIVGTFFFAFSIMEDSGYFPRMAMLIDRLFKKIGLNGRAVIPMVLGFGCDTMATMVTRVLETRRERVIATLLLALAVPCSAQLGVILGILSGKPGALLVWTLFILAIFLLVGFLTARLMPGEGPSFYIEIPPLRLPRPGNVLMKTCTRMQWYVAEIVPLFIFASILIWAGTITGLFQVLLNLFKPLVALMGLPQETAVVFLFGFFRRDYGAAGLYDLSSRLTGNQLVVAAAALTLFLPCVAQFLMMKKERGLGTALSISAFIFPFAFLMGAALNRLLHMLGVSL